MRSSERAAWCERETGEDATRCERLGRCFFSFTKKTLTLSPNHHLATFLAASLSSLAYVSFSPCRASVSP